MPDLFDISADDLFDANNQPKLLNTDESVSQALRNFLTSRPDDYIHGSSGGIIHSLMFKNLSPSNIMNATFRLKNAIVTGFTPKVSLIDIIIDKDIALRAWKITVFFQSPFTNKPVATQILIKDFSDREREYGQIIVEYTGANLVQFSQMKKIMTPQYRMVYDQNLAKYTFGQYVLNNLTTGSPEFAQVETILNG